MTQVYIFVQDSMDEEFLRRILPADVLADAKIITAGIGGIPSYARTILITRKKPVVVVMDSYSVVPAAIAEQHGETEELIRFANASIPVKVIMAVPEMEAWFFAAPQVIARELGTVVSDDFIFLGKRDPKGVLELLAQKNQKQWDTHRVISLLDDEDVNKIRAIPAVNELISFLRNVQKDNQAA
jgi:hypothetical protein